MIQNVVKDILDPTRAAALHATLGLTGDVPDTVPMFWHYIYFWDAQPPENLGRDGHPKLGGLIPNMGLPRRMWAGGEVEVLHPLQLGRVAEKRSTVLKAERKFGRTGDLAVVSVGHEIWQDDTLALRETQSLIYRAEADLTAPKPAPIQAATDETRSETVRFTPNLLFRYSALTFNGHRIHYDRDYAQNVEGYDGLVVHGPLLAQLLVRFAEEVLGPLTTFSFRATAPLFDFEVAELCSRPNGSGLDLWVRGPDGRQCMTALAFAA